MSSKNNEQIKKSQKNQKDSPAKKKTFNKNKEDNGNEIKMEVKKKAKQVVMNQKTKTK